MVSRLPEPALTAAEGTLGQVLAKARFWLCHQHPPLPKHECQLLTCLLNSYEGKPTSSKWARMARCSQDMASRDLADLAAKGILTKDSAGSRSNGYYLVAQNLVTEGKLSAASPA